MYGGVWLLQPIERSNDMVERYSGTANAIQRNWDFIRRHKPDYVVILAADHIYKMNYDDLITFHQEKRADLTVATLTVSPDEASRFGILQTDDTYRVLDFEEKPLEPKSNLGSMGIYVFSTDVLNMTLREDDADPASSHDFGKNIIPRMIKPIKLCLPSAATGSMWEPCRLTEAHMDCWPIHRSLICSIAIGSSTPDRKSGPR
jgi:glucose-1-phosphate adenylyltransferase